MQQAPRTRVPVFSVLEDRAFRAIWYAGSLHELSRRMELLILSWLILQTTNSPFQLGLVLVFNNLPRPVLSLFSGIIADRYSRLRILIASQTVNTLVAGAILVLIILDVVSTRHVFLAVVMQGVTKSLEDPSRRTGILDIVGEGRLVNALSWTRWVALSGRWPARSWVGSCWMPPASTVPTSRSWWATCWR